MKKKKVISIDTVYLRYDTLQPGTVAEIRKFLFYTYIFVAGEYCGRIVNSAVKGHFKEI